jgi:Beta-lactamase
VHESGPRSTHDRYMPKLFVPTPSPGAAGGEVAGSRSVRQVALAGLLAGDAGTGPVSNSEFCPGEDALPAQPFAAILQIQQVALQTKPALGEPVQDGRDARLFPGVTLEFFTVEDHLIPVQMGEMVAESAAGRIRSYWRVIAQVGRTWREAVDEGWSRASFPVMLVSDLENQSHQGLATFAYRNDEVSGLRLQFVQHSAPWLLQHFVAWGFAPVHPLPSDPVQLSRRRDAARAELAGRLPAKPWNELLQTTPPGTLDGFGGPLYPKWRVGAGLVRNGVLYYQESMTPYGPYPYPLEMRFAVRSVMKSIATPLALLRLAQVYGASVLNLRIGDYVSGLDPKWNRIRFLDAANMATGFGGTGSLKIHPNDMNDGYLEGNYDAWYRAPSRAEKIQQLNTTSPYPWEPGTVVRYRDQDFFLLGAALDAYLKSMRGAHVDIWDMVKSEVLAPIGIHHAPALRTRESDGTQGVVLFNAGLYPTLEDLARIAMLYQNLGAHAGQQILDRKLSADLLAGRDALRKDGAVGAETAANGELYKMGFHFVPYVDATGESLLHLPRMWGAGENEVMLYPNGLVSIIMGSALRLPEGEQASSDAGPETVRAVERLASLNSSH